MEKNIQVSLFASAVRTKDWMRFYDSLKNNTINWEVVFVGNKKPDFDLPENFKFIYANVKPCQCYEIAARNCSGELIGWTCDDATYEQPLNPIPQKNLDKAYEFYKKENDRRNIVSMHTIEDGRDVWHQHRFFGKWNDTPIMAPMALMNRETFIEIGGYDKNFISAQAENDIIMRIYELGGKVILGTDAFVYIGHRECHIGGIPGEHKSMIRQYYVADRQILENLWVKEGYGCYGPGGSRLKQYTISKTRLKPIESFDNEGICDKTQGPIGEGEIRWE
ncbi:hypothetical protein LCGC14_2174770 [marine sediment metagenome]|uniref:Glycosyltransferase 2-like domain-containing protein n=1 Tax=marine sediment metagenome TaxID=412755 RepID=A0A0F9G1P5_9ZZZZ